MQAWEEELSLGKRNDPHRGKLLEQPVSCKRNAKILPYVMSKKDVGVLTSSISCLSLGRQAAGSVGLWLIISGPQNKVRVNNA